MYSLGLFFIIWGILVLICLGVSTRGFDGFESTYLPDKYFVQNQKLLKIYTHLGKYEKGKRKKLKDKKKLKITKGGYCCYLIGLVLFPIYILFIILSMFGILKLEFKLFLILGASYDIVLIVLVEVVGGVYNWMNKYYYKKYKETARLDD